jgi:hypothetical protein
MAGDNDETQSAFDAAAVRAREETTVEPARPTSTLDDLAASGGSVDTENSGESAPRSRRGRRAGAGSKRTTRARRNSSGAADDGSAPPGQNTVEPIPPATVKPLLKQMDKTFVRMLGSRPLDEEELENGAASLAPLLDHYAPLFLDKPWAPFALWAVAVYVPRAGEVYETHRAGGGRKPNTFPARTKDESTDKNSSVAATPSTEA